MQRSDLDLVQPTPARGRAAEQEQFLGGALSARARPGPSRYMASEISGDPERAAPPGGSSARPRAPAGSNMRVRVNGVAADGHDQPFGTPVTMSLADVVFDACPGARRGPAEKRGKRRDRQPRRARHYYYEVAPSLLGGTECRDGARHSHAESQDQDWGCQCVGFADSGGSSLITFHPGRRSTLSGPMANSLPPPASTIVIGNVTKPRLPRRGISRIRR